MDCRQLGEVLDCYVDGELAPEAMAAADAHVRGCSRCARTVAHVNALRSQVRRTVGECIPPRDLPQRVQGALDAAWQGPASRALAARWLPVAAALLLLVGAGATAVNSPWFAAALAAAIDRTIVGFDEAERVTLEGTLLCRDCELEKRHGIRALCPTIGHHGALATSDGRLWSIVEQPASSNLVHNSALLGSRLRVRGRLFRRAGSLAVEQYDVLEPGAGVPPQVARAYLPR